MVGSTTHRDPKGTPMIYLVAGLDRSTLDRWHDHVMARDAAGAARIACSRAAGQGLDLVVAAVIGPYGSVEADTPLPAPSSVSGAVPARYVRSRAA
jgi:hypothetical protein